MKHKVLLITGFTLIFQDCKKEEYYSTQIKSKNLSIIEDIHLPY